MTLTHGTTLRLLARAVDIVVLLEPMDADLARKLGQTAVTVAVMHLGQGEAGANNSGPFLRAIGGRDGEEWCALFAGYCHRMGYGLEHQSVPSWCYRNPAFIEVAAKRLTKQMGSVGYLYTDPRNAAPGDLVCWNRKLGLPWQGHVGVVESVDDHGLVHSIEGNVGAYPAMVHRLVHDVTKESLWSFATLRPKP